MLCNTEYILSYISENYMYVLDVVHILLSEIQKGPLRCLDKLIALSKNAEDGVK